MGSIMGVAYVFYLECTLIELSVHRRRAINMYININ